MVIIAFCLSSLCSITVRNKSSEWTRERRICLCWLLMSSHCWTRCSQRWKNLNQMQFPQHCRRLSTASWCFAIATLWCTDRTNWVWFAHCRNPWRLYFPPHQLRLTQTSNRCCTRYQNKLPTVWKKRSKSKSASTVREMCRILVFFLKQPLHPCQLSTATSTCSRGCWFCSSNGIEIRITIQLWTQYLGTHVFLQRSHSFSLV